MRSVIAVIAGYLVFGISAGLLFGTSGRDPKVWPGFGFAVFATLYGMAFAFAAGCIAARLARRNPAHHAAAEAAIIALVAAMSMLLQAQGASIWSEVAVLLFMAPAAAASGFSRFSRP
jgi:hypothetical protein